MSLQEAIMKTFLKPAVPYFAIGAVTLAALVACGGGGGGTPSFGGTGAAPDTSNVVA